MNRLPIIYGEKVVLRPINDFDTENIVRWRNNPNVVKNFIFREPFTRDMHEKWLETRVQTGEVVQYIIEDRQETPVGSVYFRDIDKRNNSAEFGIFIGEDDARGHGYGGEATQKFVEFGFLKLSLHRIMLRLIADNYVARNAYLAAGFIQEGIFRDMVYLDGEYKDIIFMAFLNK